MSDEKGYEIVFPFVNVASKGGPYEDEAYTAGYQMGMLHMFLQGHTHIVHKTTIRTVDAKQAELVAMHNGYTSVIEVSEFDEWSYATFIKANPMEVSLKEIDS